MDSIYQAWKLGKLDAAIKLKILKGAIEPYLSIYDMYLKYRDTGMNYTEAVQKTADTMSTSEMTVKRAIATVI